MAAPCAGSRLAPSPPVSTSVGDPCSTPPPWPRRRRAAVAVRLVGPPRQTARRHRRAGRGGGGGDLARATGVMPAPRPAQASAGPWHASAAATGALVQQRPRRVPPSLPHQGQGRPFPPSRPPRTPSLTPPLNHSPATPPPPFPASMLRLPPLSALKPLLPSTAGWHAPTPPAPRPCRHPGVRLSAPSASPPRPCLRQPHLPSGHSPLDSLRLVLCPPLCRPAASSPALRHAGSVPVATILPHLAAAVQEGTRGGAGRRSGGHSGVRLLRRCRPRARQSLLPAA